GLLTAVIYSWLSGLSIPAIRAIFALSLAIYLRKQPFYCFPWQWATLSMGLILLFDPLSILSDSFCLSCIAVFAILYWGSTIQLNRSIY
ncbi:ComEC/Rec2 family competence protein, partial [Pseudomonas marginalis]|uniref:ComEC/Rec2 family competence protein n=1 Tax=Pseudomonas marginalis TaxID=298 RepID=UPI002B1E25FE